MRGEPARLPADVAVVLRSRQIAFIEREIDVALDRGDRAWFRWCCERRAELRADRERLRQAAPPRRPA